MSNYDFINSLGPYRDHEAEQPDIVECQVCEESFTMTEEYRRETKGWDKYPICEECVQDAYWDAFGPFLSGDDL